jgi:magnesium chelatase family protein
MGPPGSGKTLLARCLPGILPPLSEAAAVEVACIRSAVGESGAGAISCRRPFRAPHHSISAAGLVGGGSLPRPGEITRAHHGVLFLDEMLEFTRASLEALRQPLEDGRVTVARARRSLTFPAAFALVGAMNPCPCGHRGDPRRDCVCTSAHVERYRSRLSGPLLDRIDLHVEVPPVGYHELLSAPDGEPSSAVRRRVEAARAAQHRRFASPSSGSAADAVASDPCNARMSTQQIEHWVPLDAKSSALLQRAVTRLGLSARSHHRILRVARTLADLSRAPRVQPRHLAEAIHYRTLDRPIT